MVVKNSSPVVTILVVLICSTSGQTQEDWKLELKEAMTRQVIQLVQKFNKDPFEYHYCANGGVSFLNPEPICLCAGAWKGNRCDDNPCNNVSCNTGTCYADGNGHPYCVCPCGTSGQFCEIEDNPCNDVDCNTGTCYADGNGIPHCVCPVGTSGQFCEIKDSCLKLESPSNGQVHVEPTEFSATYTCKKNYSLCGSTNGTCGNDGEWNSKTPVCIEPYTGGTNLTVAYGGSTYYFSSERRSFENAQEYCENLGGNLLSVNSADEWNFIKCVLTPETRSRNVMYRWFGLLKSDETWAWTSGEPLTVSYWYKNRVNTDSDNCGVMYYDLWASTGCNIKAPFICEKI